MTTVTSTAIMTVLVFDDGEVDGCEKGERLGWPVGGSIGENISVIVNFIVNGCAASSG